MGAELILDGLTLSVLGTVLGLVIAVASYSLGYRHGHHDGASLDHPWRHGREA